MLIIFIFFAAGSPPADGVPLTQGGILDMYSGWVPLGEALGCRHCEGTMSDESLHESDYGDWVGLPQNCTTNTTVGNTTTTDVASLPTVQACRVHFAMVCRRRRPHNSRLRPSDLRGG